MNKLDDTLIAEAAAWHAASESDAMDWDGFTRWLEADPRNARAYDEVALTDSLVADHREALISAQPMEQDNEPVVVRPRFAAWTRWAGAAIAASLVGLMVIPNYLGSREAVYETGAASRTIALEDGSSVVLAPHSRLEIDGRAQDHMALAGGAWFDVIHDPDRPLTITAGGTQISDIGTRFDVQSHAQGVRVEVEQGNVQVSAEGLSRPIRLAAGKGLLFDSRVGKALVSPVNSGDAGEWRSGRLSYDSTPLPLVADDLSRYAGVVVKVPDSLANRQFSGTLVIGDGETAARDLSQVMDLALVRDGSGYRLVERGR